MLLTLCSAYQEQTVRLHVVLDLLVSAVAWELRLKPERLVVDLCRVRSF